MREPAFQLLPRPRADAAGGQARAGAGAGRHRVVGGALGRARRRQGARRRHAARAPPRKKDFAGELHTGAFTPALLDGRRRWFASARACRCEEEIVRKALAQGIAGARRHRAVRVARRATRAKVLAITGTNGKSTVTALTGHLLRSAGMDCEVAGNIGPPALAALTRSGCAGKAPRAWVLELSSYQLETTWSLAPDAAAMLNLTEDHLDRYAGLDEYGAAKARIFQGDGVQVLNRGDPRSMAMALPGRKRVTFGLDAPRVPRTSASRDGKLVRGARTNPARSTSCRSTASHNVANALAACALACPRSAFRSAALAAGLRSFQRPAAPPGARRDAPRRRVVRRLQGHQRRRHASPRCEGLAQQGGADPRRRGQGPGLLAARAARCAAHASHVLLIGRDAPLIEKAIARRACRWSAARSLEEAVERAAQLAKPAKRCCSRRPARASTCSATTSIAATCSPRRCRGLAP